MPKSVVCGGETYFSRIVRASSAQPVLDRPAGRLHAGPVGLLLRLQQPLVVLARELAVDRQPERLAVVAPARQLDRELDPRAARRHGLDVGGVLLDGEHLLEQAGELHLAEHAARLDVVQHAAQRADVAAPASASRRCRDAPAPAARPPGGSSRPGAAPGWRAASRRRWRGSARASSRCPAGSRPAGSPPPGAPRPCAGRWPAPGPRAGARASPRGPSATPPGAFPARRASAPALRATGEPAPPARASPGRARHRAAAASRASCRPKASISSFWVRDTSPCCASSVRWKSPSVATTSWRVTWALRAISSRRSRAWRSASGCTGGGRSAIHRTMAASEPEQARRQPFERHPAIVAAGLPRPQAGAHAPQCAAGEAPAAGPALGEIEADLDDQRQHRGRHRAGEHDGAVVDREPGDDALAEAAGADERGHRRRADVDHRRGLDAGEDHRRRQRQLHLRAAPGAASGRATAPPAPSRATRPAGRRGCCARSAAAHRGTARSAPGRRRSRRPGR